MFIRNTLLSCILVSALATQAGAAEKGADVSEKQKPSLTDIVTKTVTSTVVAINYETRIASLKGQDGNILDVQVSSDVKDLKQFKAGDQVTSEVIETMTVYVRPNDGSKPGRNDSQSMHISRPGEKPMKVLVNTEEMVAEVVAINNDTRQMNLKLPNGLLQTYFVPRYFTHLDNVKKGDQMVVKHSKTTVIKVTKMDRPAAAATLKTADKPAAITTR